MAAIISSRPLLARWSGKNPRFPTIMPNVIFKLLRLPEDDIHCYKCDADNGRPKHRPLNQPQMAFTRNLRATHHQADEFAVRFGLSHEADYDGDDGADQPAPECAKHVFRHV